MLLLFCICLFIRRYVCLFLSEFCCHWPDGCPSSLVICLSVCLCVGQSLCLSVCLSLSRCHRQRFWIVDSGHLNQQEESQSFEVYTRDAIAKLCYIPAMFSHSYLMLYHVAATSPADVDLEESESHHTSHNMANVVTGVVMGLLVVTLLGAFAFFYVYQKRREEVLKKNPPVGGSVNDSIATGQTSHSTTGSVSLSEDSALGSDSNMSPSRDTTVHSRATDITRMTSVSTSSSSGHDLTTRISGKQSPDTQKDVSVVVNVAQDYSQGKSVW